MGEVRQHPSRSRPDISHITEQLGQNHPQGHVAYYKNGHQQGSWQGSNTSAAVASTLQAGHLFTALPAFF